MAVTPKYLEALGIFFGHKNVRLGVNPALTNDNNNNDDNDDDDDDDDDNNNNNNNNNNENENNNSLQQSGSYSLDPFSFCRQSHRYRQPPLTWLGPEGNPTQ